jgi:hypothetical protein
MTGGRTDGHQAFKEARQKGSFGCGRTPSNLWLRPALEFHEARSLCQSRHAAEAAVITIAVAKAPNNATIIAMIATKVSVIDIRFRSSIFAVLSMRASSGPASIRLHHLLNWINARSKRGGESPAAGGGTRTAGQWARCAGAQGSYTPGSHRNPRGRSIREIAGRLCHRKQTGRGRSTNSARRLALRAMPSSSTRKRRIDRARGVVHRHDQVGAPLACEPGVPRAVLVQHHARQRMPLALGLVRPLARRLPTTPAN